MTPHPNRPLHRGELTLSSEPISTGERTRLGLVTIPRHLAGKLAIVKDQQQVASADATPWAGWLAVTVLAICLAGLTALAALDAVDGTFSDDVAGNVALFLALGAYAFVGALLLWRLPRHRIAWVMCAVGLGIGAGGGAQALAVFMIAGRSQPLAGSVVAAWIANWYWYATMALVFVFMPLLFPTGRLISRRWRPVLAVAALTTGAFVLLGSVDPMFDGFAYSIANPLGVDAVVDVERSTAGRLLYVVVVGCAVAALASLVIRFRRAQRIERAQIKWVAYASAVLIANLLLGEVLSVYTTSSALPFAITIGLFPASVAVAVLRYRLFDIDRLMSRTISYGLVTALLVGTYLILVVTLQEMVPARGELAVAVSTLAVAALFHPLRRRVQDVVDRRFDRARYDAVRTVAEFSQRLRSHIDLDVLVDELEAVTTETMQPALVALWLPLRQRHTR